MKSKTIVSVLDSLLAAKSSELRALLFTSRAASAMEGRT